MSLVNEALQQAISAISDGMGSEAIETSSTRSGPWTAVTAKTTWREKGIDPEYNEEGRETRRQSATLTMPYTATKLIEGDYIRVAADNDRIWAVESATGDNETFFQYECKRITTTSVEPNRGRTA